MIIVFRIFMAVVMCLWTIYWSRAAHRAWITPEGLVFRVGPNVWPGGSLMAVIFGAFAAGSFLVLLVMVVWP